MVSPASNYANYCLDAAREEVKNLLLAYEHIFFNKKILDSSSNSHLILVGFQILGNGRICVHYEIFPQLAIKYFSF